MAELDELRARLAEAEETLRAIRSGEVDALLIAGEQGHEIKLLGAGDHIYRQFIEAISEGTATLTAGGEILSCNDCLAKTLRRPLDQVVGTAMRNHLSPDDYESFNTILAQAGPQSRRRQIHLKTSEGRLVPVYLSATLLHSAGAAPVICLVFTDLEEVISAEETLRESEEEFRATFEQAAVGFAHATPDGRWLRVNQKLADIVGYTREELLTKTFREITHPDDLETDLALLRQTLAGAISSFSMEKRYIRKDTSIVWINLTVSIVRKPSGEPSYFIAVIEDIMRRKQAEESLRESEEKFSKAFHTSPYAITISRPDDGTIIEVNEAFISVTGFTREEALSNSSIGLKLWVNEEDRKHVVTELNAGRVVAGHEYTFQTKDGKLITGLFSAQIIMLKHGPCILTSINDITDRKLTEDKLRASQQLLEGIINAIPVRVFWKDKDLVYLGCNASFARDAGFADPKDLVGKDDFQMGWREQADLYRNDDRQVIESDIPKLLLEEPQTTPEGKTITLLTSKLPLRNTTGEIVGVLGTYIDITESKRLAEEKTRMEDQLRQSQKVEAIGQLAGGVAHDFNNMMAIILGYGEMLLGELAPEAPARKWAEQIMEAGKRSAALTRQLLAFSRKQTLLPEVLDLNALLRNLEKMFGRLIKENIELEFKLAGDLARTKADPGQIEQVVTNLVLNARDAMVLGGKLTVETANVELDQMYALGHESVLPGSYVMLAVTDTGCGMDKATMARLFEPFFTTKEKGKGTGLGLATAYGIVKQSGGYIWAYSEPDQGTSFKIYMPQTDAALAATVVEAGGEVPRGSGERILLVEDEAPFRELCETVLVRLGYRVDAAGNGLKALLMVQEQGLVPDLVITDVIMPVMSGAEMTERLRRDRPDLKVLYMSGYPDDAIARHGVLEPGTPFLQKPFAERALAVKVREALGMPALGGEAGADKVSVEKPWAEENAATTEKTTVGTATGPAVAPMGRRVLMIDDDDQFRELVQHFCKKHGHVFAGVDSTTAALLLLAAQPFDVLLVDLNIPGTSGEQVLREIRAAGNTAPAIVLTGDVASADMDVLRPLGAVRSLEKSSDAGPLLRAIEENSSLAVNSQGY